MYYNIKLSDEMDRRVKARSKNVVDILRKALSLYFFLTDKFNDGYKILVIKDSEEIELDLKE